MTEEETISVEQEAQGVTEAAESEEVQEAPAETNVKKRKDVDYNWAEARRKMHELDRQNRDLAERLERMQKAQTPEIDELSKLADDDIVTKAQANKLAERRARQIAEEVIKQHQASTVEERIKARYGDFDQVVTPENIEILKQRKPSLALSLAHNPDPFAQAEAVYEALKMMGTGEEVVKNADKERAIKNSQKPVSVNSAAKTSALGNAHLFENGLTPELKKQLWKEMEDCRKRA